MVAPRFRRRHCACAWPVGPPLSRGRAEPVGRARRPHSDLSVGGGAAGPRGAAGRRAGRCPAGGEAEPRRPGRSPDSDATDAGPGQASLPQPGARVCLPAWRVCSQTASVLSVGAPCASPGDRARRGRQHNLTASRKGRAGRRFRQGLDVLYSPVGATGAGRSHVRPAELPTGGVTQGQTGLRPSSGQDSESGGQTAEDARGSRWQALG